MLASTSGPASATAGTGVGNVVVVETTVVDGWPVVDDGTEVVVTTVENVVGTVAVPGSRVRSAARIPISKTRPDPTPRPINALRWRRCAATSGGTAEDGSDDGGGLVISGKS